MLCTLADSPPALLPASCTFFPLSPPCGLWASLIYPVTTSILSWSWMGTGQQASFLQDAVAAPWAVPSFALLYAIQPCRQQSVWSGCCCAENRLFQTNDWWFGLARLFSAWASALWCLFLLCLHRTLCPPAPQLLLCILTFLLIFLQQTSAPEGHPLFTVSRVQPCDRHVVDYGWLWIMNGYLNRICEFAVLNWFTFLPETLVFLERFL